MKNFLNEFRNFAVQGNMIDMAIGIIMGTAFNAVINALVKNVIMPPLLVMTNQVNFAEQKYVLEAATAEHEEIAIGYGILIESVLDFLIIGLTIFVVIKGMNRFKRKAEDPTDPEVETPQDIAILSRIEGLMERQNAILEKRSNA